MPPADDTPASDPTVSQEAAPSPGRQKLSAALLDCLDHDSSSQSFQDCLVKHEADVPDWIAEDLRAHFNERWNPKNEKARHPLDRYTRLLADHKEAVKEV